MTQHHCSGYFLSACTLQLANTTLTSFLGGLFFLKNLSIYLFIYEKDLEVGWVSGSKREEQEHDQNLKNSQRINENKNKKFNVFKKEVLYFQDHVSGNVRRTWKW